jgi:SAM-dependent methyltransferase
MSEKFEHDDAQKGPTFDDPGKNYNDIPGVEYEDHFLMYKRAGNHAAYLQKVIEYADGGGIEVACGTGTQTLAVAPYLDGTVGIELDSERIELTYARCQRLGAESHFVRGDMFNLPFSDNAFSVGFNSGVFQHFDSNGIRSFLSELVRVSRDHLVLSVANRWYPHNGRASRRLLDHDRWSEILSSHDALSLLESHKYGDRTHAAFDGIRTLDVLWTVRWVLGGLEYPRSWFVLSVE